MIDNGSGKHFDPDILEAFRAEEQKFIAIRDQYAETDSNVASSDMVLNM